MAGVGASGWRVCACRIAGLVAISIVLLGCQKRQSGAASARNTDIAFVLLSKSALPSGQEIVSAFSAFADKGQQVKLDPKAGQGSANAAESKDLPALEFAVSPRGHGVVALMAFAVPNGEADAAAAYSVSAILKDWKPPPHQAHLLVSLGDTGIAAPAERLSLFTSFLAAVAKVAEPVGIYWGGARATHDPAFLIATAQQQDVASRLMLWTGVSRAQEKDGRLSLLSMGMRQLDLPDLLFVTSQPAGEGLGTFFDMLSFVVHRGKPIPENDTVGRTAEEKLPVHYVASPIDPKTKVWRVDLR